MDCISVFIYLPPCVYSYVMSLSRQFQLYSACDLIGLLKWDRSDRVPVLILVLKTSCDFSLFHVKFFCHHLKPFKGYTFNSGWTSRLLAWAPESVALPITELEKICHGTGLGEDFWSSKVCRCYSWHAYHVSKWKCGESSRMYGFEVFEKDSITMSFQPCLFTVFLLFTIL